MSITFIFYVMKLDLLVRFSGFRFPFPCKATRQCFKDRVSLYVRIIVGKIVSLNEITAEITCSVLFSYVIVVGIYSITID